MTIARSSGATLVSTSPISTPLSSPYTMSSSSDEGEVHEDGPGELKASHQHSHAENGVDRRARNRDSPARDSASHGSGSSFRSRSPRGYKRSHDDGDYYEPGRNHGPRQPRNRRDERSRNSYRLSRPDHDARRFQDFYDDADSRDNYRRSRITYDDLDRPASRASEQREDYRQGDDHNQDRKGRNGRRDHPGWALTRARGRSRDPGRAKAKVRRRSRSSDPSRRYDRAQNMRSIATREHRSVSRQGSRTVVHLESSLRDQHNKITGKEALCEQKQSISSTGDQLFDAPNQDQPLDLDREELQPVNEEDEIERRRQRRIEIMAKHGYWGSIATQLSSNVENTHTPALEKLDVPPQQASGMREIQTSASPCSPASRDEPSPLERNDPTLDDEGLMNMHGNGATAEHDGPSAADYDPTVDMKEDERRDERRHGQKIIHGEARAVYGDDQPAAPGVPGDSNSQAPPAADNEEDDGDEDDEFDMFAEEFDVDKYHSMRLKKLQHDTQEAGGILVNDDKDGYYRHRVDEVFNGRYEIKSTLGQGMFARVMRAIDLHSNNKVVAIKIMRNNYALRKGGYTEIAILRKLNEDESANKRYIVQLERSFEYRGHLCMVFEGLEMNLRHVLRKFGHNVGINLKATRLFARQIFIALDHMRKCSIIHADLKPDNILINEKRTMVKICDLGTAIDRDDAATAHAQITPYLISRFYRAPEVILGMEYDYGIDMWSVGCTLFELFTGKILFPGESNNQMLKVMMETRGRMYPKYYRRGKLWQLYFDERDNFISVETDKATHQEVKRIMTVKPTRSLGSRLDAAGAGMTLDEKRELDQFRDLLESCLALHAERRMTPSMALQHAFFKKTATHTGHC